MSQILDIQFETPPIRVTYFLHTRVSWILQILNGMYVSRILQNILFGQKLDFWYNATKIHVLPKKLSYFCAIVSISKTFVSRKNYLLYLPHVKAIFANSPKCTPKPISGAKYCKHLSSLVYIIGS